MRLVDVPGDLVLLAPGEPGVIDEVAHGRLYKDGEIVLAPDDEAVRQRRGLGFAGVISVGVALSGGLDSSTVAALAAGARLMVVPRSEVGEARKRAGSRMRVVGVRTLDEAVRVLEANGGAPVVRSTGVAAA